MQGKKEQIEKFRRQLRTAHITCDVDFQGMLSGQPSAFTTFFRYLFCEHSTELAKHLVDKGFSLLGLTDHRFMETVYRVLRDLFNTRPPITLAQFYTSGFVERKLEMATLLTTRLCSLIPPMRSFTCETNRRPKSGKSDSAGLSSRRIRQSQPIPRILPDVLLRTSKTFNVVDPTDMNSNFSEVSRHFSVTKEILTPRIGSVTPEDQLDKPTVAPDSRFWAENSHNQAAKKDSSRCAGSVPPTATRQQNQCSTFSANVPSVGQVNQSQRLSYENTCLPKSYAKNGNSYHLLNSNPRPCSYGSVVFMNPSKTSVPSVHNPSSKNTAPTKRNLAQQPYSSSHCWSSEQPPVGSQTLVSKTSRPVPAPSRDSMQEILQSLSQLTGKVDTMLTRLTTLELRLPRMDSVVGNENREAHNKSLSHRPTPQERPSEHRQNEKPTPSVGFSHGLVTVAPSGPCPTSLVESTLPFPKPELLLTSSQATTSVSDSPSRLAASPNPCASPDNGQPRFGTASSWNKASVHTNTTQAVQRSVLGGERDMSYAHGAGYCAYNGDHRYTTATTLASGMEDTVKRPSSRPSSQNRSLLNRDPLTDRANPEILRSTTLNTKQPSAWPLNRVNSPNIMSSRQPAIIPDTRLGVYTSRFNKPALFRRTDSFEAAANNSNNLENRPPRVECHEQQDRDDSLLATDAYHAQVERITSILAETQGLLESQRSKVMDVAS